MPSGTDGQAVLSLLPPAAPIGLSGLIGSRLSPSFYFPDGSEADKGNSRVPASGNLVELLSRERNRLVAASQCRSTLTRLLPS